MSRAHVGLAAALTLTAACSYQGPALAGYEGLQRRVQSYYAKEATERSAACPNPWMNTITRAEVVEETPERVVMELRYRWVDDGQSVDSDGNSRSTCQGFSRRRFTFTRASDGGLEVESMSPARRF